MKVTTAILCRTNAPLVQCAFDLIKRRVKIKIVGRDIAKKLKETIGEVMGHRRHCDITEFEELLDAWLENIVRKYGKKERKQDFVAECSDMHGCLKAISENCDDTRCLYSTIDRFFVDGEDDVDDDCVLLCSGHRSKGLEWDRVFVLRTDLMPHPGAETEADLKQEENIRYVIKTRAKQTLVLCPDQRPG